MTQIICSWLNDELYLSQYIDQNNFASSFSNGYLIGEILKKYELMDDFDKLSKKSSAEAKLNNFLLLEPTLKLLGLPFNNAVAKDVMQAKFSIIINLLYQLFIALENKKKSNTTALSMQTMQAPATTHLQEMETVLYQQRLKKITPRQSDMDLKELIKKYQDHQHTMQMKAEKERILSADGHKDKTENHRQNRLNRSKFLREEQYEQMKRLEAAVVKIPKQPHNKTIEAIEKNKKIKIQREAEIALKELDDFENRQRNNIVGKQNNDMLSMSREESFSVSDDGNYMDGNNSLDVKSIINTEDPSQYIQIKSNDKYVSRIRGRLESDKEARIAREKRRRKVLINCLKSHYQQEENERENMIAMRLMRQSQMERRIAVQLLQLRHEKDVIKSNRMERESQYQERREKEFINAMEKEREFIQQMKLVNMDNLRAEQDLYDSKKAQHKLIKYQKHYQMSEKIVNNIVDFSCKISEFKTLTEGKIPPKMIRDWKLAFFNDCPIYDVPQLDNYAEDIGTKELDTVVIQDISVPIDRHSSLFLNKEEMDNKLKLLDQEDIMEYKQLIGEWQVEDETFTPIDRKNNVLDWIVDRLQHLSNPVDENSKLPMLPSFPIKAAVVGKCFSGKSMLINNLVKNNRCVSIVPQEVINQALLAFEENEVVDIVCSNDSNKTIDPSMNENNRTDDDKTENQVMDVNLNASMNEMGDFTANGEIATNRTLGTFEESLLIQKESSPRALLGQKIKEELMNGKSINDQLLVDTIIEYIKRIPDGTGWIIDDFPATYQQAKLFEKASTGYEEPNSRSSRKKNSKSNNQNLERGLDALILLNTSDSDCLARAMTISENQLYNRSNITSVSKDVIANLQTSLTNFADHWPKLLKFYSRINEKLVKIVDSHQHMTPTEVYLQVEIILDDIIKQKEKPEPSLIVIVEPIVEIELPVDLVSIDDGKSQTDLDAVSKEVIVPKKSTGRKSKSSSRGSSAGSKSSDKKSSSRKSRSKSKTDSVNSKGDKKSTKKETTKPKDKDTSKRKGSKGSKSSRGSKSSSKGSRTGSGKRKKSKQTPAVESEKIEQVIVPQIIEPQPGDTEWVYSEKPLNQELASTFYEYWESLIKIYLENCKLVFRDIRYDREEIIRYIYTIKTAFRQFLDRPDAKQDYLEQFQKDFNEIPEEWREDEEVQQELHQRIFDLKNQLLEISQENEIEAEKEMEKLKNNRWVEDKVGMISNQYLNLMQSEFDRFQDILRFLRDYFKAMVNPQLDEFKPEFLRLPLIEIPVAKEEEVDQQETSVEASKIPAPNTTVSPANKKGAAKNVGKPAANENPGSDDSKELTEEEIEAMFKTRIPLIEYKTPGPLLTSAILTSIPTANKPVKGDKTGGASLISKFIAGTKTDKKMDKQPETSTIPNDLDERLLFDALQSCYTFASAMIDIELSFINQKEDADKPTGNAAADKGKTDKKGKGGKKSRTPTPKKGAKDKTATVTSAKSRSRSGSAKTKGKGKGKNTPSKDVAVIPSQEAEETEEDKQNRLYIEKSKLEYLNALQKELSILKLNMKLIMNKGIGVIKDIKSKMETVFQLFSTWIADKLLREDISIKESEKVFRYHVEVKQQLKEKIVLIEHKFYLNPEDDSDKKIHPVIRPSPIDPVDENYFTISQLNVFYNLFQLITDVEDASISVIDFVQFINEALVAADPKSLPVFILSSNRVDNSIANIAEAFSCDKEYVNWRLFLLACSEPWPWPSQKDLLNILAEFKELDQLKTGFVTREQYDFIDLWFTIPSNPVTPVDISIPKTINRDAEIKKLFFNIFKTSKGSIESHDPDNVHYHIEYLDYENMLIHFAIFCTNNFYSGIIRALSIIIGEQLPYIPVIFKDIDTQPADEDMDIVSDTNEDFIIPIQAIYKVLSFGHRKTISFDENLEIADLEDSECERDTTLINSLKRIYETVEEANDSVTKFSSLMKHEGLLEWFTNCQWFKHIDLRSFFVESNEAFRVSD